MNELLQKYKNPLIVLGVVVVAFFIYSAFFGGGSSSPNVLTSQTPQNQVAGNSELLTLLLNLRSITLDESLFGDPAFDALIDFGQELSPEPTGRENPFSPVGSDAI